MKACGRCGIDKSSQFFAIDTTHKDGLHSICKVCKNEKDRVRRLRDHAFRASAIDRSKKWCLANEQRYKTGQREWWRINKQHVSDYRKAIKPRFAAYEAKRRAKKGKAQPPWADNIKIKQLYTVAADMSSSGIKHHVDHIIPLNHPLVCGLHVETNLRVIPATENLEKSNKFNIKDSDH